MLFRALLSAALLLPSVAPAQTHTPAQTRTPVIVELFTSEGCSSCPPADALLARLDRDQPIPTADIIILGEHVDYWDQLGWRDRFSSPRFTERQVAYTNRFSIPDSYTPQMIVAGQAQFNGADPRAAAQAIVKAALAPGLALALSAAHVDGKHLTATLTFAPHPGHPVDLFAALVSPIETTKVRSGENGGQTLHHAGVVLSLTRIGSTRDSSPNPLTFHLDAPANPEALRLVVFAQSPDLGPILGATSLPLSSQNALTARK